MTIDEIARLANVSRATVSRVLNNNPRVQSELRARVLSVIEKHNYTPNAAARTLATRRTNTIALLVPGLVEETCAEPETFYPLLIQSVTVAAGQQRRYLMLCYVAAGEELEFYRSVVRSRRVDGLIIGGSHIGEPLLELVLRSGFPAVLIGRHLRRQDLHSVDAANVEGACQAVEHLLARGRRRIATITYPASSSTGVDRLEGYRRALAKYGVPFDPRLVIESNGFDSGEAIAELAGLIGAQRPDALFAASDTLALDALQCVRALGLRVPEDIAIVGFDDQPNAARSDPPLTTVRQPIAGLGREAVALLLRLIEQPDAAPQRVVLPTELVVRASS